ncbi:hypothetical protein [Anabaena sp. 4-3]|uniref:hypothetical protein n=1 Tax=Anabaena sp. 4-3 TaxID=1811979 RepID=UPI00082EDC53|nr:hypothetical protein [Anabaena sp. 4-3]
MINSRYDDELTPEQLEEVLKKFDEISSDEWGVENANGIGIEEWANQSFQELVLQFDDCDGE